MVNNPSNRVPTQEKQTYLNEKNDCEEESKIQNECEQSSEQTNDSNTDAVTSLNLASEMKKQSIDAEYDGVPAVCNVTLDVTSEENIPNDCDSSLIESNDDISHKELKSTPVSSEESRFAVNTSDCLVNLNNDASNLDEQVVYDTRQLNREEVVDDLLTDGLISTNSMSTQSPSQFSLNVEECEEKTTGTLIDVELSSNPSENSKLEEYDDKPVEDFNSEQKNNPTSEKDGQVETNSKLVNSLSNVLDIMNTFSEEKNVPEINDHPVEEKDSLNVVDTESNEDIKNNVQIENTGAQEINLDTRKNVCTESLNKFMVDPLAGGISNDSSYSTDNEVLKSNQDLKDKIGNSIKSMFDNNEHMHLNLLEKQNIANLQSNTLKKVNNLFSSIKSYNFSNFRTNEEGLLKDKTSSEGKPEVVLKNLSSTDQIMGHVKRISNSTSPQENDNHIISFSSLRRKDNFKDNNSNQNAVVSSNATVEIANKNEPQRDNMLRDLEVQNLKEKSKMNEATNGLQISKIDIGNHRSSHIKAISELQEGYVLNTDLIHSVRNATRVPNKSISLDSSPVKNNKHYDVQDELYLLKETNIRLLAEISRLEEENNRVRREFRTHREEADLCKGSMTQQLLAADEWREQSRCVQEAQAAAHAQEKKDLEAKLDKLKKDLEGANKEKEAAVMRYVTRESELITARTERDAAERKRGEAVKEKEALAGKLKTLTGDKARVSQLYDDKCTELNVVQRSLDKVSDEIAGKDIKLKWLQSRLDKEIENGRAVAEKLAAVERQQSAVAAEQSRLKVSEDSQRLLLQEIDCLKKRTRVLTEENNGLSLKVQKLEQERLESDEGLSKCKSLVNSQNETISQLRNQLANMEDLKNQLTVEHERVLAKGGEVERVQQSNAELSQDMATCRTREAELLQFTEKLTAKNVRLQSEFNALEAKASALERDVAPLTARISHLEAELTDLRSQLDAERSSKEGDNRALARLVAERTKQNEAVVREIEELKSENQILKRKHATTVRELNKELSLLKKKCESSSTLNGDLTCDSHGLGYGSRASSCQSLNETQHSPTSASIASTLHSTLQMESDRTMIIDRLVELQRSHARVIERAEFLEEHNAQLVAELQKKSRILQNYILREQSGALTSRSMDVNKAEVSKHGGIMASLYSSKPADGGMTLDLSLEINRKLQAVLEDTILKNITLKENIDTLGEHIERLSKKS